MIGIDSNVLVRFFVRDNEAQTAAATRFIAERTGESPGFISAVVVCELVWVLQKSYGYADAAVHEALTSLFESSNIIIERADLVDHAIAEARQARADISDCIIAALATAAGADKTVTFDKPAAKRISGMELLA